MAAVLGFVFAGRFRDGLASWTQSLWVQALAWLLIARTVRSPSDLGRGGQRVAALGCSLQFAAGSSFSGAAFLPFSFARQR